MRTIIVYLFVLVAAGAATALTGQTTGAQKGQTPWPKWPVMEKAPGADKPAAMGSPPASKREKPSGSSPLTSETPRPKELFERELETALSLRKHWLEIHRQIPKTIPHVLDAAVYEKLIRLVENTRTAKKKELAAWNEYHQACLTHWRKRLEEGRTSDDIVKAEILSIQALLDQEQKTLADVEQRIKDSERPPGETNDSTQEIQPNLLAIRDAHVSNIEKLRTALAELSAAVGSNDKIRIIAAANIALVESNLKTNSLERTYWQAVYTSVQSLARLFQDQVTPRPRNQPTGDQL